MNMEDLEVTRRVECPECGHGFVISWYRNVPYGVPPEHECSQCGFRGTSSEYPTRDPTDDGDGSDGTAISIAPHVPL